LQGGSVPADRPRHGGESELGAPVLPERRVFGIAALCGHFAWLSLVVSFVLFLACSVAAGLPETLRAWGPYRRCEIGAAVVAHMVNNALIVSVVRRFGKWNLWMRLSPRVAFGTPVLRGR
jgi:hypothetical protein